MPCRLGGVAPGRDGTAAGVAAASLAAAGCSGGLGCGRCVNREVCRVSVGGGDGGVRSWVVLDCVVVVDVEVDSVISVVIGAALLSLSSSGHHSVAAAPVSDDATVCKAI